MQRAYSLWEKIDHAKNNARILYPYIMREKYWAQIYNVGWYYCVSNQMGKLHFWYLYSEESIRQLQNFVTKCNPHKLSQIPLQIIK